MLSNGSRLVLPFVTLVISLITLIIGLDCIWRVEKRLRKFLILLSCGVAMVALRKTLLIMGLDANSSWYTTAQLIDISMVTFMFAAFVEIYRIVRFIDGEKK